MKSNQDAYSVSLLVGKVKGPLIPHETKVIADSEGKAARFLSIQTEYAKAPQVTKKRIFYETMEDVFSDMDKVIIDKAGGDSVVPYLPLPELSKKSQE